MKEIHKLRGAALNIVVTLLVALIVTLMTPATYADAAETAAKAGTNGLWSYTTSETGTYFEGTDKDGNIARGIRLPNGKEVKFVTYVVGEGINYDFVDGQDYWSYRYNEINGVVTITSRQSGTVKNQSGYAGSGGVVYIDNYGWVTESHWFDAHSWTLERYNYDGQITASINKTLMVNGVYGTVTTTTLSETAPTTPSSSPAPFWPTAAPTATPYNPYWYPTPTVPPFTPPTTPPTTPPVVQPTQAPPVVQPTQAPPAQPTQPPAVQPTQAPQQEQEVVPPSGSSSGWAFNFSSIKHRSKLEKAAWRSLRKFNRAAKRSGNWEVQRRYVRKKHTGRKVVTLIVLKGETEERIRTFKLRHYTVVAGRRYRSSFRQGGKLMSTSGVYDALRHPERYMQ